MTILKPGQKTKHAHKLVVETANEMAHELYDTMMQDDKWYTHWKTQYPGVSAKGLEYRFVQRNLPRLIEGARVVLAGMLAGPAPQVLKDQIYEALVLDATLKRGRQAGTSILAN